MDNINGNHYFEKLYKSVIFKKEKTFEFYKANMKPMNGLSDTQGLTVVYDDRAYALARVCYGYITFQLHKLYQLSNNPANLIIEKEDKLDICQNFMIALNSDRVYKHIKDVKWSKWNTYWSKQGHISICYSNCPGTCKPTCQGGTCYYYFPSSEKDYQLLPDNERADVCNIFDDKLFWLASLYNDFVKEFI